MNKRRNALTHRVRNANSDNLYTAILETPHFARQLVDFTCWNTVGDKNGDICDVRTVSVGNVEYFGPHESQSAGRICIAADVCNTSHGVNE